MKGSRRSGSATTKRTTHFPLERYEHRLQRRWHAGGSAFATQHVSLDYAGYFWPTVQQTVQCPALIWRPRQPVFSRVAPGDRRIVWPAPSRAASELCRHASLVGIRKCSFEVPVEYVARPRHFLRLLDGVEFRLSRSEESHSFVRVSRSISLATNIPHKPRLEQRLAFGGYERGWLFGVDYHLPHEVQVNTSYSRELSSAGNRNIWETGIVL